MPPPGRTHLPIKQFIAESNILDEDSAKDTDADLALLRLPAPGLRGTFAKAYALLAKLVSKIGWDELLKTRSAVFVMEEEYRAQKAQTTTPQNAQSESSDVIVMEDGTVRERSFVDAINGKGKKVEESGLDDDASTKGLTSSTSLHNANGLSPHTAGDIPTIKISSESDHDQEHDQPTTTDTNEGGEEGENNAPVEVKIEEDDGQEIAIGLEKPSIAAAPPSATEDDTTTLRDDGSTIGPPQEAFSFSNKRLCERWLDNLFMVLYEDLRIWTIFRAEVAHFKTQHIVYKKTGTEWEILGDLGLRLHHKEEAKEAFLRCLDNKFSAKAWMKLLEMFADEGDLQRSLNAAIRLTAYQHRWYQESSVRMVSKIT
ncbi:hypothetical protein FRC03_003984 [Tulasnella sp. 419]|nr:hypothetical protein FRC03_003984 [Tulasnella sp. 419]